jgi:purine-binding chemotaxis protein CheW
MLHQLVTFTLDGQPYALPLASVQQVVRMVEVVPLPKTPEIVLGVINLHGKIVPVLNLRKRFGLQDGEASLSDHLIIADTARRRVALVVDAVTGVLEKSTADITNPDNMVSGTKYVEGIAKLEEGMLFIHNLDRFLSCEEEIQIEEIPIDNLLARAQGAQ